MTSNMLKGGAAGSGTKKVMKSGMSSHLLIPVDFSDMSMLAVTVGFRFAEALGVRPVILHVYPMVWYGNPMPEDYSGMYDTEESDIMAAIEEHDLQKAAEHQLLIFKRKIEQARLDGTIPDLKYTTLLQEGIPEDEILDYCRNNSPRMVVMSTRGIHKKNEELIGSVTAEVLDSCRVPVFTVPERYSLDGDISLKRVLMFCTLEQYDEMGLEKLMDTFDNPEMEIWLMPLVRRDTDMVEERLKQLLRSLSERWPGIKFHHSDMREKSVTGWIDGYIDRNKIQLVIAPNRKSNIFTRLFSPSVAHQCLFTVEIPMLALPVVNK